MASLKSGRPAAAAAARASPRRPPRLPGWAALGLLAAALATRYPDAPLVPFINEDYIFLEKTRDASFASLWGFQDLAFHWYRPWSRELHYWLVQRLLGPSEIGFHAVSLALLLAVLGAYYALVRALAGVPAAAVAAGGVAAMAAWAVPALWVAGVQDLWMLLFALLSLHALARGRTAASAAAFALALLSKETAAVLPAVATWHALAVERRPLRGALARSGLHWGVAAAWVAVHPLLGGRLWNPAAEAAAAGAGSAAWEAALRTPLALISLDAWPAPDGGAAFLAAALPAAALLALLAAWAGAARGEPAPPAAGRAAAFGAGWALLGWLPLLMPGLGWHAYYALFGALGAWLALGRLLSRRTALAAASLAACALLGAAQAATPSEDWGSAWYQRRAGEFLRFMRADLARKRPTLPPRSRLFFTDVPSRVGFLTPGGPSLRAWYRDATLSGDFYARYRPRDPAAGAGADFFFRYDSAAGWVEIAGGEEDLAAARAANPRWERDHRELAAAMARAEDWTGAAGQFEKLATAFPESADYALNAGVCREMLGDSARAARWYRRAAATPGASAETREFAARFERRFRARP